MVVSSRILSSFLTTAKFELALDCYTSYASAIYLGGDMFSRQNNGQNNRTSDRILQVGMFAASAATAGVLYVLCKFLMINDSSVSGEIVLNGTQAEQVAHGSPIAAFLFSYFGAFTFLIPLMLLYCFYLVLKNRARLFVPDFTALTSSAASSGFRINAHPS